MLLDLSGYHLTYDVEFSKAADFHVTPDGSTGFKTQFDWGGRSVPSNSEAEFYSDPSIGISPFVGGAGQLSIIAQNAQPDKRSDGMPYVSGMITTEKLFSQHGGYFEIRAQVAGGQGIWPAFWMLPTNGHDYPELDILEDPNLGPSNQYFLHSTAPSDGGGGFVQTKEVLSSGYHTYGVEWNDLTTTFYFDHKTIAEYVTPAAFANLTMYMIANLAVGGAGSWPGTPAATSIPATYKIDYIRAFSKDPSVPAIYQEGISSPDHVNTKPVYAPAKQIPVVIGSGIDAVTLHMSEDFYKDDAMFKLSLDGQRIPGLYRCEATQIRNQFCDFVLKGTLSVGTHVITINYVNDYYDGQPYLDRNLYLNSAEFNGSSVQLTSSKISGEKPADFSFIKPKPVVSP